MSDNKLAVQLPPAMVALAGLTGLAQEYLIQTVKAQCFKGAATDAQVDAFISIACEMKVNPLLPGMLYAYPVSGGGIVPIMGPSGVYKKLAEHSEVESWETVVYPEDVTKAPTHATTKIYRKGRERPLEYTALLSEWKIDSNPNWTRRPRHMLSLRSLKHCANQIIHGIPYDEDDRVIMGDPIDITPGASEAGKVERAAVKERSKRGAATVLKAATEVVVTEQEQQASQPSKTEQSEAGKSASSGMAERAIRETTAADILAEAKALEAKHADEAKAKAAALKEQQVAQADNPEMAKVPRALLHADEAITVEARVKDFAVVVGTKNKVDVAYVTASIVSPELEGDVLMVEGGITEGAIVTETVNGAPTKVFTGTAIAAWQKERPVRLTVRGRKIGAGLKNFVEKIEVAGGVSSEPAAAEDVF